jgi:hypothetical protein
LFNQILSRFFDVDIDFNLEKKDFEGIKFNFVADPSMCDSKSMTKSVNRGRFSGSDTQHRSIAFIIIG